MVYWHDGTGEATAGKHMSEVCSGRGGTTGSRMGAHLWRTEGGLGERGVGGLTLLGPGPPQTEGDEGHNDEDEGPEDNNNDEVGEVAGPRHAIFGVSRAIIRDLRWNRLVGTSWQRKDALTPPHSFTRQRKRRGAPTFGFQDHHVAELALSLLVEALHLDVVGGFRLEVGDGVPVPVALHHVFLVVAVVVAVRRAVVDVEAVDGRVVHRGVLQRRRRKAWSSRHRQRTRKSRPFSSHLPSTSG